MTTARLLHLTVGQVLVLPDSLTAAAVRLRVTGLFRPRDPAAPYWRLSLLGTSGKLIQGTFVTYGPMLADPSALGPGGLPVSASARGAAREQLLLATLAEAVLLALTGAAAGIVAGSYLADVLMPAAGLPATHPAGGLPAAVRRAITAGAWWPAAVIAGGVIAVMMWPSLRPVTPGAARARRGRPAVLAATARAGLDAALIALGALAFWELRRYSAAARLPRGTLGVYPVLAVAPVLALAGIALLPLRVLPAAARQLDRLSTRGRRLTTALASWQVRRRARPRAARCCSWSSPWRPARWCSPSIRAGVSPSSTRPRSRPAPTSGSAWPRPSRSAAAACSRGPRRAHRDAGRGLR